MVVVSIRVQTRGNCQWKQSMSGLNTPFLLIKTWNSLSLVHCCCGCPWIQKGEEIIGIAPRECSHGPQQVYEWLLSLILENETLELPSSFFTSSLSCHPLTRNNGSIGWMELNLQQTNQPFPFHFDGVYKGFFLYFPFFLDWLLLIHFVFIQWKREVIWPSIPETPLYFHLKTRQMDWTGDLFSLAFDYPKNSFVFCSLSERESGFEVNKQGPRGIMTMNWGDFCWFVFAMREI